jgi:hypothetical protein
LTRCFRPDSGRIASSGWVFIGVLLGWVLLAGCSPVTRAEQAAISQSSLLPPRESLGQTLVANYDGLAGIEVYIDPKEASGGESALSLHLRASPAAQTDLASSVLPISEVDSPGYYRFSFAPIAPSSQGSFYFFVENNAGAALDLATAPGTAYLDGSLYANHQPQDAQLAFQLVYDAPRMAFGLLKEAAGWGWSLLLFAFLFGLPGWALLAAAWPGFGEHNWIERIALSSGVGLAIFPVMVLWTNLVGLHLGPLYAWIPPLAALGFLAWQGLFRQSTPAQAAGGWKRRLQLQRWPVLASKEHDRAPFSMDVFWPDLSFIVLAGLIFAVRFWAVRSLPGGLWGDSYQHTLIVQLMLEHGGLFERWAPYADLTTFTYHFGFHTWAAVFQWLSGLPVASAVLHIGQILNGMSVIMLYPLALFLVRQRWAGVFAILVAGLLMPVPMDYTNWGRYTQLAGQVVLPAAVLLLFALPGAAPSRPEAGPAQRPAPGWRLGLLLVTGLVWSALAFTHYRVLILAVLMVPGYLLLVVPRVRWLAAAGQMLAAAVVAAGLFLPWFIRTMGGKMVAWLSVLVNKQPTAGFSSEVSRVGSLPDYAAPVLWILLVLALAWAAWQRRTAFLVFGLWGVLAVIAANPGLILLPGNDIISNFTILIASYLLIGPLVGAFLGEGLAWLINCAGSWARALRLPPVPHLAWGSLASVLATAAILMLALLGTIDRSREVQPHLYALLTRPDVRAFELDPAEYALRVAFPGQFFPGFL